MFDLRTHIRNPKTQEIEKKQPYRLVCEGAERYYLRDGLKYHLDGSLFPGQNVPEPKVEALEPDKRDVRIAELETTQNALLRQNQAMQSTLDKLFAKLDAMSPATAHPEPALPLATSEGIPVEPSMPNFGEPQPVAGEEAPRRGRGRPREEKVA